MPGRPATTTSLRSERRLERMTDAAMEVFETEFRAWRTMYSIPYGAESVSILRRLPRLLDISDIGPADYVPETASYQQVEVPTRHIAQFVMREAMKKAIEAAEIAR